MFKTDKMPFKCDAKSHCDASNAYKNKNCNSKSCRDFKMLYEGRLQRYCLLLSKEKEVIHKLGFVKETARLRSRTFDNADLSDANTRRSKIEAEPLMEETTRRKSAYCLPILRSPKCQNFLSPSSDNKTRRRFSETGRLSPNCEAKIQQYKRHSLPSKIESPVKDAKSKRRQEEMQKKAQLRVQALKSLETDCIKAKQLMNRFKSLSMTTLDLVGKDDVEKTDVREDRNGKRRIQSWHI